MNGVDLSPFGSHCQFDKYKIDAELSPEESVAVDYILQELQYRSLPFERIKLRRRSNSYLSLIIDDIHDFCRIKAGKKSKESFPLWHPDPRGACTVRTEPAPFSGLPASEGNPSWCLLRPE